MCDTSEPGSPYPSTCSRAYNMPHVQHANCTSLLQSELVLCARIASIRNWSTGSRHRLHPSRTRPHLPLSPSILSRSRTPPPAVRVEVRQRGGHGGDGHAVRDGQRRHAPPRALRRRQLLGELRVHQQRGQLGVALVGLADGVQELRADDAAALGKGVQRGEGERERGLVRFGGVGAVGGVGRGREWVSYGTRGAGGGDFGVWNPWCGRFGSRTKCSRYRGAGVGV